MNLIRILNIAVVDGQDEPDDLDYDSLSVEERRLFDLKVELESKLFTIQADSSAILQKIQKFSKEMEVVFQDEHTLIAELRAELDELVREAWERTSVTETDEEIIRRMLSSDDMWADYERSRSHNESMREQILSSKKKSDGVKRLYRKIAAKAHPDKNPKPWLADLFLRARKAYDANDFPKLERIWKCIATKTTWHFLQLEEDVVTLHNQVLLAINEQQNLIQSDLFNQAQDYESHVPQLIHRSSSFYKQTLNTKIAQLKEAINIRDRSRYPKQQQSTYVIINVPFI